MRWYIFETQGGRQLVFRDSMPWLDKLCIGNVFGQLNGWREKI